VRGMGRVFKRGEIYWIAYCHRGKEVRESARSTQEADAKKLLKKRIGEIQLRGRPVGQKEERLTWNALAALLTEYHVVKGSKSRAYQTHLKRLGTFFDGIRAIDIDADRVRKYAAGRKRDKAAIATINAELRVLKLALNVAHRDGLLSAVPHIERLPGEHVRQGFTDVADFNRLVEHLPEHAKDPARFLYMTSWRGNEMRTLEWRHVELEQQDGALVAGTITLAAENSKTGQGRVVRLKGALLDIIARAHAKRRFDCLLVFQHEGRPVGHFRTAWLKAAEAVGLGGLRPHDLRRSGIRNMIRAGISRDVAKSLSGHRTDATFSRYNITSEGDLDAAAIAITDYNNERNAGPPKISPIRPVRAA
jgi:integrase